MACLACLNLCQGVRVSLANRRKRNRDTCIFCPDQLDITLASSGRRELFRDHELVVFEARTAASPRHLLVCPLEHIDGEEDMQASHIGLLRRMDELGRKLAAEGSPSGTVRTGFHKFGWRSIDHLHLHAIALPFHNPYQRMRFSQGWPWFITVDELVEELRRKSDPAPHQV
eukprot:tig00020943_g16326.t1